ncbi:MAG: signal peptidase I [Brevibacterium sp.]
MSDDSVRERRWGAWLGAALLNVLAVLGVVCIVLVILSFIFNISIMMFKTGSMSPTIPAGSIAFVREIPAIEMEVGDVVTVDRGEGTLPVTHRVIVIDNPDESSGPVNFEMQGDANDVKDPEPYTADTVRKVMFSVPGIAPIIQSWRNPFLLGGITIAASLLVVWAFWPRRTDEEDSPEDPIDDRRSEVEALRTPARSPKHALVTPVIAAMFIGGLFGPGGVVAAAPQQATNEVHGQYLRMEAFGDEAQMRNLSPGASANWSVDVWTDAPDEGTVKLEIGSGQLSEPISSALLVDVRACPRTAASQDCASGTRPLLSDIPVADLGQAPNGSRSLLEMASDEAQRVQVTVTLASNADVGEVAGLTSSVRLTAIGHGEEISVGPGDPGPDQPGGGGDLPRTGIEGWLWFLLAAFVLIAVGSTVVARTKRGKVSS